MPGKIRFGMVGTGFIADWVLAGARQDARFEAVAICSRTQERADAFAAKHGIPHTFTLLEEMAASPLVDAVYIATPNFLHASQSILCMRHGKHVLCEKPLASNAREARQMVAVARECGVTLMEAMISTLNPNFRVVQEYLPRLGTIRRYFASFCQYSSRYDKFRQGIVLNAFNPELSNGAMMDIGVYTVYPMVALFGRPLEVEAQGIVLSSGADGQGAVNFRYEGMNATVLYSKIANSSLPSEIQGEEGNLLLDAIHTIRDVAYLPRPAAASGRGDAPVRHSVGLPLEKDTYYYEVAEFIDLIEQGRIESTVNSHENSLVTMEIIDQVRRQLGVSYPADRLREPFSPAGGLLSRPTNAVARPKPAICGRQTASGRERRGPKARLFAGNRGCETGCLPFPAGEGRPCPRIKQHGLSHAGTGRAVCHLRRVFVGAEDAPAAISSAGKPSPCARCCRCGYGVVRCCRRRVPGTRNARRPSPAAAARRNAARRSRARAHTCPAPARAVRSRGSRPWGAS